VSGADHEKGRDGDSQMTIRTKRGDWREGKTIAKHLYRWTKAKKKETKNYKKRGGRRVGKK